jgi:S1-C subfamily serine protease
MNVVTRVAPVALLALAAPLFLPGPVRAQEPEPDEKCVCVERTGELGQLFEMPRRARLGVMLGEPTDVDGRSGVRLEDVPEGTPARRAGLRPGDVIVALDGASLGSNPTASIVESMEGREPGDTVAITFVRDDDERTVRVVTEAAPAVSVWSTGPRGEARIAPRLRFSAPADIRTEVLGPGFVYRQLLRDGMDLVAVNPGLGEYFGTDEGVLVTEIDDDSPLGLRSGDVILAIDGRDVRDPAHVRSILSSYREDEEVVFRIVRERRTTEITGRPGR